jgi:hypothetical protein
VEKVHPINYIKGTKLETTCIVILGSIVDMIAGINILSPLAVRTLLLIALIDGITWILAITTGIIMRATVEAVTVTEFR